MEALVAGDLAAASAASGLTATPYLADHAWLWNIRLPQVASDQTALGWIARAAVTPEGDVVGLVGFHGPPDERGMVEVAYGVDPAFRRRGCCSPSPWSGPRPSRRCRWSAPASARRTRRPWPRCGRSGSSRSGSSGT